jgi:dUTP pyrophosphatase
MVLPASDPAPGPEIPIRLLAHARGLPLPAYATPGSAGMDLLAAIEQHVELAPGGRLKVPTGLCMAIPIGYEGQVRPRSGLAARHGITVVNAPGTVDSDYRGEVAVLLVNLGQEPVMIRRGMRVAQIVFAPVSQATWVQVEALPDTARGGGGFGHTGA